MPNQLLQIHDMEIVRFLVVFQLVACFLVYTAVEMMLANMTQEKLFGIPS